MRALVAAIVLAAAGSARPSTSTSTSTTTTTAPASTATPTAPPHPASPPAGAGGEEISAARAGGEEISAARAGGEEIRATARFAAANQLLAAGDAAAAARAYEALAAEGLESPALHVNLGAARVRQGRRGAAVASFLRALRLDPSDGDARANLAALRSRGGVSIPEPPLLARVVERTPDDVATAAFLAPWVALFAFLALGLRARGPGRGALLAAAIVSGVAAAAGAALVAGRDAERRASRAVVILDGAGLRAGPEAALRPARTLQEGTLVRVLGSPPRQSDPAAVRVRLPDGDEGFVARRDLEPL